jgi:hypothetical protein
MLNVWPSILTAITITSQRDILGRRVEDLTSTVEQLTELLRSVQSHRGSISANRSVGGGFSANGEEVSNPIGASERGGPIILGGGSGGSGPGAGGGKSVILGGGKSRSIRSDSK